MILTQRNVDRFDDDYTFTLDSHDLNVIAHGILRGEARCHVRHKATQKLIGNISYATMKFRLLDRAHVGLAPIELGERIEAFASDV